MLKVKRDILNPETARKVKGMSLSALSDYLWKLYAAGYTAGFLEGRAAARGKPVSETDTKQ